MYMWVQLALPGMGLTESMGFGVEGVGGWALMI